MKKNQNLKPVSHFLGSQVEEARRFSSYGSGQLDATCTAPPGQGVVEGGAAPVHHAREHLHADEAEDEEQKAGEHQNIPEQRDGFEQRLDELAHPSEARDVAVTS
jgi:hypothetical protein